MATVLQLPTRYPLNNVRDFLFTGLVVNALPIARIKAAAIKMFFLFIKKYYV
jgi:hypothetical protein